MQTSRHRVNKSSINYRHNLKMSVHCCSRSLSHVRSRRFFTSRRQRPVLKPMNFRHRSERRCWERQRSKWARWESVRFVLLSFPSFTISSLFSGALAALASFDWTGLLGASLVGLLGLYFIPMRRSTIKREMKERIDKTRLDLVEQLSKHFSIELDLTERKMRELIQPYA